MSDATETDEKVISEFNDKWQELLGTLLETHSADIISKGVLVVLGQLLQTIMLINFKKEGYMTNVEQYEIVDMIVHHMRREVYPMVVEEVSRTHPEWFEKNKTKH